MSWRSENNSSSRNDQNSTTFVRSILPPPPDERRVVLKQVQNTPQHISRNADVEASTSCQPMNDAGLPQQDRQQLQISARNTTLIGDYISTVFPEFQSKWMVQATGNATFSSTMEALQQGLIVVNRKYIFLQLGGNQIRSADAVNTFNNILNLVVAIRERSSESRIFLIGVLPRPVENDQAKPYIMRINRWFTHAVERVDKLLGKVKFLPVHLKFLNGSQPRLELFREDDGITLSPAGAMVFRNEVFRLAGFVRNDI